MQRDILLLTEMVDAAEQAGQLTAGITVSQLETDRQRRDALLWNFTVLGEAAAQLSAELTLLLLDQLGGIWEIIFWMTLPELLPTGFKRSL